MQAVYGLHAYDGFVLGSLQSGRGPDGEFGHCERPSSREIQQIYVLAGRLVPPVQHSGRRQLEGCSRIRFPMSLRYSRPFATATMA